jgi:hypothetical protein
MIGYVSTNEKTDGKWRKIKIKVTREEGKSLKVRARKGYYAPSLTTERAPRCPAPPCEADSTAANAAP